MKKLVLLFFSFLILFSCKKEDIYIAIEDEDINNIGFTSKIDLELLEMLNAYNGVDFFKLPDAGDYGALPQDYRNLITREKVELGKLLFHETATAASPKLTPNLFKYACASCHPVASSFFSGKKQGIGEGGLGFGAYGEGRIIDTSMPLDSVDILPIKVPTILNAAYQEVMLWSGSLGGVGLNEAHINKGDNAEDFQDNLLGYEGLETQGMSAQVIHGILTFSKFLASNREYDELFDKAFPELEPIERYSRESGGLAIAAYLRSVIANQAPWQEWLRGKSEAMNDQQKRGAKLFFSKGLCYTCHTGPALKSNGFYSFGFNSMKTSGGIIIDEEDFQEKEKGRGDFTKNPNDDYKFKVPTLYNLKDSNFFGHGASFTSIRDVISYKNRGVKQNENVPDSQLAGQFGNMNLTENEIDDLVAFISNALYDPNLERYAPTSVLSGNCFPNNDSQSKLDLGCN